MSKSPFVTTAWLHDNLKNDDIVVLDASWHLPDANRNPQAEYALHHITGAHFFDIDEVCDKKQTFPHTVPTASIFMSAISKLGVKNTDTIVIYDNSDLKSSGRVWWLFRLMGHSEVYVLDGGLKKWRSEGKATTEIVPSSTTSQYSAATDYSLLKDKDQILTIIDDENTTLLDARAAGRFNGTSPEPRPGLRSGHIPSAKNLPFSSLFKEDGTIKSKSELQVIIADHSIDLDSPIVTSCGSGVTACNLALAFAEIGKWDTAVYDGSWTEWGSLHELPIETE